MLASRGSPGHAHVWGLTLADDSACASAVSITAEQWEATLWRCLDLVTISGREPSSQSPLPPLLPSMGCSSVNVVGGCTARGSAAADVPLSSLSPTATSPASAVSPPTTSPSPARLVLLHVNVPCNSPWPTLMQRLATSSSSSCSSSATTSIADRLEVLRLTHRRNGTVTLPPSTATAAAAAVTTNDEATTFTTTSATATTSTTSKLTVAGPSDTRNSSDTTVTATTARSCTLWQHLRELAIHHASAAVAPVVVTNAVPSSTKNNSPCNTVRGLLSLVVGGPGQLRRLRTLDLRACRPLTSLEGLGCLPLLEVLDVSDTAIASLRDLGSPLQQLSESGCPALRRLVLQNCSQLTSLDGLEHHVCLEEVDASGAAALVSVRGLRGCRALKKINLENCRLLKVLEEATLVGDGCGEHLEELNVSRTAIATLSALHRCRALRRVDLRVCQQLNTLQGLEAHPVLEEVILSNAPVNSLVPLRSCPALRRLRVERCPRISSLRGLEGHARLEALFLSHIPITSVSPLQDCISLRKVSLNACRRLTSLEGIGEGPLPLPLPSSGHRCLEELDVSFTPITSLQPLAHCQALKKVVINSCLQLRTLEGFVGGESGGGGRGNGRRAVAESTEDVVDEGALVAPIVMPHLEEVDASFCTGITSVRPLVQCGALKRLRLHGCQNPMDGLRDLKGRVEILR